MYCAETAEDIHTISFAYDSVSPDIRGNTSVNPSSPFFPVDLSIGDILRQIAAEWLEMALGHNGEIKFIENHHRSFEQFHR